MILSIIQLLLVGVLVMTRDIVGAIISKATETSTLWTSEHGYLFSE